MIKKIFLIMLVSVTLTTATTYRYSRELVSGNYDICLSSPPKSLTIEVDDNLPGKNFHIICISTTCTIVFDIPLTPEEKTILNNTVTVHKGE